MMLIPFFLVNVVSFLSIFMRPKSLEITSEGLRLERWFRPPTEIPWIEVYSLQVDRLLVRGRLLHWVSANRLQILSPRADVTEPLVSVFESLMNQSLAEVLSKMTEIPSVKKKMDPSCLEIISGKSTSVQTPASFLFSMLVAANALIFLFLGLMTVAGLAALQFAYAQLPELQWQTWLFAMCCTTLGILNLWYAVKTIGGRFAQ